ncbi:hypothetical protein L596_000652 [Steinernema carpocapsae]|uniref:Rab-GAP TBC domain-containing protein n=2 Tax=Steinernema carpocapsae TaxID=34508 RepID=A0A4V6I761_STECR|nr:hypothetical protein L596_000652 [Steinernema carpocapsae]
MFTRSSPLPSSSPESHRVSLLKRRIPLLNGLKIEDIRKRLRIISEYKNNQKLCLNGSTDKVYDDYGFVIDNYSAYENPFSVQRKRKDHEDFEKWLPIFRKWKDDKPSNDVSEAVYSGVPNAVRDYLWPRLLRVKFVRKQGSTSTYRELLVRAKKLSPFLGQIDLDVMRTFTTHRDFEKRHGNMQNSLFNILVAYSMYNTDLGYTQGMNNIAALFLMYMGEEAAFWALHSVMTDRKYTMHGLFVEGFPKLFRIDVHIRRCLIKYLPELQLLTVSEASHCNSNLGPDSCLLRIPESFLLLPTSSTILSCCKSLGHLPPRRRFRPRGNDSHHLSYESR